MKTIRLILLLASLAGLASFARAAETVTVRGLLIAASQEPGESDPRLASYVANLRRIGRFESFRLLGDDSATLAVPANAALSFGGQTVQLSTEGGGAKPELRARWGSVDQQIVNSTTMIVGPSTGRKGESYVLLLMKR
jgi:hypothetical protein